jgi:hypothetical protein
MQERVESGLLKTYIEHQTIDHFVINTHGFHNAHLLRATLPCSLTVPIPLHPDQQAKHIEIAGSLCATQEVKQNPTKVCAAQKKLAAKPVPVDLSSPTGSKKRKRPIMEEMDEEVILIDLPMHSGVDS